MAIADTFRSLREVDFDDLSMENLGTWPTPIKVLVWLLAFAAILAAGYFMVVKAQQELLAQEQTREVDLRKLYERRAEEAANLEAYRVQMAEIEKNFGVLLSQLPEDTEVPGLLDDITYVGTASGLTFELLNWQQEVPKEFYTELPIELEVSGN